METKSYQMNRQLLRTLVVVLLVLFANACKKEHTQTTLQTKTVSTATTTSGAILDPVAYAKLPKANLDEVRLQLPRTGASRDLKANGTPPTSVYLNYPELDSWDQGTTGACVSWAIGFSMMSTLNNEFPVPNVSARRSPWFIFRTDHSVLQNECNAQVGMQPFDGMYIAKQYGVPSYGLDYNLGSACQESSNNIYADAATNKIGSYYALTNSIYEMKMALSYRLPIVMAFRSYPSLQQAFDNHQTYTTLNPDGSNKGHAVCIVGYDDAKHAFLVENSWGKGGGDIDRPGFMWFDYDLFSDSGLEVQLYIGTPNKPLLPMSDLACAGSNVYGIGLTNIGGGGNAIYRWGGSTWERLAGAAIAVAGNGNIPWLVNNEDAIYAWGIDNWTQPMNSPTSGIVDIAFAGSATYAISNSPYNQGGYRILRRASNSNPQWVQIDGAAVKIITESSGTPWVINYQNYCYRGNNGGNSTGWVQMPGMITDIASGGGNTFALGINIINAGGYEIYRWNGSNNWILLSGTAMKIAVNSSGIPYIVNAAGHLYRGTSNGSSWTQLN